MKQVEENCGRADEDVRQVGRVDLAEIARKKAILPGITVNNRCLFEGLTQWAAYLGNQLALLKLAVDRYNLSIPIHLGAPQARVQRRLCGQRPPLEDGPRLFLQPHPNVALLQRIAPLLLIGPKDPLLPCQPVAILLGRLVRRSIPRRAARGSELPGLGGGCCGALLGRQGLWEDRIEAEEGRL